MKVTKEHLWKCLEAVLMEKACTIEGEIEELKDGLFDDYKTALKYFGKISPMDFIETFVEEMFHLPLHMCDNVTIQHEAESKI